MKAQAGIIGLSVLAVLILVGTVSNWNNNATSSPPTQSRYSEPLLPQINGPLPNADEVPFSQAQARISYTIPLPEAVEIKKVWVSVNAAGSSEQSVAIQFSGDLLLITHKMAKPPNWDGIIASAPELKKINVNGNTGIGADPGSTVSGEKEYFHPGSVQWWVDGLNMTLYSDNLSLEDLLKVAQNVR